jgi:hypothetical protein
LASDCCSSDGVVESIDSFWPWVWILLLDCFCDGLTDSVLFVEAGLVVSGFVLGPEEEGLFCSGSNLDGALASYPRFPAHGEQIDERVSLVWDVS